MKLYIPRGVKGAREGYEGITTQVNTAHPTHHNTGKGRERLHPTQPCSSSLLVSLLLVLLLPSPSPVLAPYPLPFPQLFTPLPTTMDRETLWCYSTNKDETKRTDVQTN